MKIGGLHVSISTMTIFGIRLSTSCIAFKTVIHDGGLAQGYKAECKSCEFADDGPVARFENVLYKEGMQLRVDEGFDVLMEHRRLTL